MNELILIGQLFVSGLLGGALGYFREKDGKAAGLRTHMMVAIGATLFMLVSLQVALVSSGADGARIAAQVVSGIGFIGAGTIWRTGCSVKGLTTATSIWVSAAIGLAVGTGLYLAAAATTTMSLIILEALRFGYEEKNNDATMG